MKRLLLDVNIILDVLLERPPHAEDAAALWALIETGKAAGLLSAHAVTIVHYLTPTSTIALVTRNPRAFKASPIPVIDAATAIAFILSEESTAP